jgi:hypothetical protein
MKVSAVGESGLEIAEKDWSVNGPDAWPSPEPIGRKPIAIGRSKIAAGGLLSNMGKNVWRMGEGMTGALGGGVGTVYGVADKVLGGVSGGKLGLPGGAEAMKHAPEMARGGLMDFGRSVGLTGLDNTVGSRQQPLRRSVNTKLEGVRNMPGVSPGAQRVSQGAQNIATGSTLLLPAAPVAAKYLSPKVLAGGGVAGGAFGYGAERGGSNLARMQSEFNQLASDDQVRSYAMKSPLLLGASKTLGMEPGDVLAMLEKGDPTALQTAMQQAGGGTLPITPETMERFRPHMARILGKNPQDVNPQTDMQAFAEKVLPMLEKAKGIGIGVGPDGQPNGIGKLLGFIDGMNSPQKWLAGGAVLSVIIALLGGMAGKGSMAALALVAALGLGAASYGARKGGLLDLDAEPETPKAPAETSAPVGGPYHQATQPPGSGTTPFGMQPQPPQFIPRL